MRLATSIESVTVYRSGARVTRVAALSGAADPDQLRLFNLPLSLSDASIEVRVQGGKIATDVAVTLEVGEVDDALPPPDDEAIRAQERAVSVLVEEERRLQAALGRLEALQIKTRPDPKEGEPPISSPTSARLALIRFRRKAALELDIRLADVATRRGDAEVELADLRDAARRASDARQVRPNELRKTAVVSLEGDGAASRVELSYVVPGARWAPAYAIRLASDLRRAEVDVRAMIHQHTGEDWDDVKLTLSTAAAQRWVGLPKLKSIRIGRHQPPAVRAWRPPPTGVEALFADYHRRALPPPEPPRPLRRRRTAQPKPSSPVAFGASMAAPPPQPTGAGGPPADAFSERVQTDVSIALEDAMPAEESAALFAAPAPPPPAAAPMMARSMPMVSRSSGPGAAMAKGLSMAGGPPSKKRKEMLASDSRARRQAAPPSRSAAPAPPPEPELDQKLLEFGALEMAPASHPRRGRLVRVELRQRYERILIEQEQVVTFDVMQTIAEAERRAKSRAPVPDGHHLAASHDGFDFAYDADAPAAIPSDGQFHAIGLSVATGAARPRYVAVPRQTQDVFRTVTLDNPLSAPILRGPADIYVGGEYLLTADLATTVADGQLVLGLGVEQAIKIARNTHFEEKAAGLMRGSLDLDHKIEIDVENHLPTLAEVEVRERLPVIPEDDDDIKLTADVDPPWAPYDPKDQNIEGGHAWTVRVEPGAKVRLTARYTLRIPNSLELVGGNRREG